MTRSLIPGFAATVAAVLLFGDGCGPTSGNETTDAADTEPSVSLDRTDVHDGHKRSDVILDGELIVARSGGFAGHHDLISVQPDGRTDRVRGAGAVDPTLDDEVTTRLIQALSAVQPTESFQLEEGADQITYMVDYQGSRLTFTSLTQDNRLLKMAAILDAIFAGGG